jgi:hypothetical protein
MLTSLFFKISKLRSSGKEMTKEELTEYFNSKNPHPNEITLNFIHPSDIDQFSYYDPSTGAIWLHKKNMYIDVLLHELGHAVMERIKGSANWKLNQLWKRGGPATNKYLMDAEEEAWAWAYDNSDGKFGFRTKLAIYVCLRTYRRYTKRVPYTRF